MTEEKQLDLLNNELIYWEAEYLEKMDLDKQESISQTILIFRQLFKEHEFDFVLDLPLNLETTKGKSTYIIKSDFDYKKEPKKPRQISIESLKNGTSSKVVIRLFVDDSSMPQPDISRLKLNPYEGMTSLGIEIYERKKSIDYMKKFINETETFKWNYLSIDDSGDQMMYREVNELFVEKVYDVL